MGLFVDTLQLFDADLGVNLCGLYAGMAQQLLDEADVCSPFEHVRGTGVAEEVATAASA